MEEIKYDGLNVNTLDSFIMTINIRDNYIKYKEHNKDETETYIFKYESFKDFDNDKYSLSWFVKKQNENDTNFKKIAIYEKILPITSYMQQDEEYITHIIRYIKTDYFYMFESIMFEFKNSDDFNNKQQHFVTFYGLPNDIKLYLNYMIYFEANIMEVEYF